MYKLKIMELEEIDLDIIRDYALKWKEEREMKLFKFYIELAIQKLLM